MQILQNFSWFQKAILFHLVFAIAKIVLVHIDGLSLFTEEAQYWLWSQHVDWSYATKPPMVAWVNFLSTSLLGNIEIGVKINAIIFGFLTGVMTFKLAFFVNRNEQQAFWSAVLLYLFPFYLIPAFYFTTDAPLMFFWVATTHCFLKAVQSSTWKWWTLTGICAGLGFLSKYTMVIFMPATLVYLWIEKRQSLKERKFWVSILIAALFTVPVVIWNYQREFESFVHVAKLGGVSAKKSAFTLKYLGEYIGGQVLTLGLFVAPFVVAQFIRLSKKEQKGNYSFFVISAVITFFLFLVISINKRVEINWSFFAYTPLVIILGKVFTETKRRKLLLTSISGTLIVLGLYFFPVITDPLGFKVIPVKADSHHRMAGWKEMGEYIDSKIERLNTSNYFVFSESYHISSELAFYSEKAGQTFCIDVGRRSNQFDYWPGVEQFENGGYYGIFVSKHKMVPEVRNSFSKILEEEEYEVWYRSEKVKTYYIYVLKDLHSSDKL